MLVVESINCGYGDITAVDALSFTLDAGEILGLIGANGAGKTSTILALAGLIPIRSGSIKLNGQDLHTVPAHHRKKLGLALVPEGRRMFAELSVDENLTVGATGLSGKLMEQHRSQVFDVFQRLQDRRRQLAGSLSGGEQQMLAIGRAMMAGPRLLLIDELSLGLMPIAVDECYRVLEEIRADGIAILLVEQNTDRVLRAADRIMVLESGRLAWSGSGPEAIGNAAVVGSYLGMEPE